MSLADLLREYESAGLKESNLNPDPIKEFAVWFQEVIDAGVLEPNACTLATATPDGRPSARIVLLKGFDARGFTFFTNYDSRKGRELATNPHVALVCFWVDLKRQIRIDGTVEKLPAEESDAYHRTRPRGSQLGAWCSFQSELIPSRDVLEQRLRELEERYRNQEVPRPPNWGGYRLKPTIIEFWQGRPNRLHDRIRYRLSATGWVMERLSP